MHRIVIEPLDDGWMLRRPGGAAEWLDSRDWAERAAASFAHEFHVRSGRPACVVAPDAGREHVLVRFG